MTIFVVHPSRCTTVLVALTLATALAACSSSGTDAPAASTSVPRSDSASATASGSATTFRRPASASVSTSAPSSISYSVPPRPHLDAPAARATFLDALSYLPIETGQVRYVDWDALGHPYPFLSIVGDERSESWQTLLNVPPNSEHWSASFNGPNLSGSVFRWTDTNQVRRIVTALRAHHWSASGPDSAMKLTAPAPDDRPDETRLTLEVGTTVWADLDEGILFALVGGSDATPLPRDATRNLADLTAYQPLYRALPQFAAVNLNLAAQACTAPDLMMTADIKTIRAYRAAVARFHTVISTGVALAADQIPSRLDLHHAQDITTVLAVQLRDAAAAEADLLGRTTIGTTLARLTGHQLRVPKVLSRTAVGAVDRYELSANGTLVSEQNSSLGFNVCGSAD